MPVTPTEVAIRTYGLTEADIRKIDRNGQVTTWNNRKFDCRITYTLWGRTSAPEIPYMRYTMVNTANPVRAILEQDPSGWWGHIKWDDGMGTTTITFPSWIEAFTALRKLVPAPFRIETEPDAPKFTETWNGFQSLYSNGDD